jgi:hypothetical protein
VPPSPLFCASAKRKGVDSDTAKIDEAASDRNANLILFIVIEPPEISVN